MTEANDGVYRGGYPTVLGAPLHPDEAVLWIRTHSYTAEKVRLIIGGILFLVVLIGIFLLVKAASIESKWPKAHVLTNRRLIVIWGGAREPVSYYLNDIADLEPVRMNVRGGGVIGAVAGAVVSAAMNHAAAQNPKLAPGYWARAAHVMIALRSGGRVKVPAELNYSEPLWCQELGPLLARAAIVRDQDQWPSVPHQA